jgi:hypothetical protein
VLLRLREGGDPLGLQTSPHVGRERLGHPVRRLPVVRQLRRRRRARKAGVGAQRVREREVKRCPLAREQVGVGGLLQQGVAEGVAVVVLDEHVVGHGRAQRLEQRLLGQPRDRRDQPMAGSPAARRGDAQHRARVVGQALQPQAEDLAQVRGQRTRRSGGGGQQLLREERVALAARVQARDHRGLGRASEDAGDLRGELREREGLDLDALDDRAALLLGQERAQRVAAMQLVAAVGAHEQQALVAQPAQQRRKELERGAVRPVDVLDREDHGRPGRQPVQQRPQQSEEARLRQRLAGGRQVLKVRARRLARAQLGQQPGQIAVGRADELLEGGGLELAGESAQRRGDRGVGELPRAEGRAVAAHHACTAHGGVALELAQEPRLADAGLAGHEDRRRRAALGSAERRA